MGVGDRSCPAPGAGQLQGPYWETPGLYGEADALNSMGTIAAPLLAGFSLAAMVQTLTIHESEARWPGVALLLFLLAAVLFITTVQAMFWARGYQTTPEEIKAWWPDAEDPERQARLRRDQSYHAAGFRMWANRGRVTYSAALLCLLAALTILAVPSGSAGQTPYWRWLAVTVGAAAFAFEAVWTIASFSTSRRMRWLRRPLRPPVSGSLPRTSAGGDSVDNH
jgi:hypothetical protein